MVAGYMDNSVIVWDLNKMKIYYDLDAQHKASIEYVKFLSGQMPTIISADKTGYIYKTHFKKSFFMTDPVCKAVMTKPLSNISSLSTLHMSTSMP